MDYLNTLELPMTEDSISKILMCFIDYDDWTYFKKYFQVYFESKAVSEPTVKKVISALVEKSALDVLRFVVTVTMREKNSFMNLKLSENQYKCIILSLLKSNMTLTGKIVGGLPAHTEIVKYESAEKNIEDDASEGHMQNQFEVVKSEAESSDEFFEIIDESMLNKIIEDIVSSERSLSK